MTPQETFESTITDTSQEQMPPAAVAQDLQRRLGEGEPRAWALQWNIEGLDGV